MTDVAQVIGWVVIYGLVCGVFSLLFITLATIWHFAITRPTLRRYGAECPTEGFWESWGRAFDAVHPE